MITSDFKLDARRKLDGKWGKAALIALAYLVVFFVIGFIFGLMPDNMSSILSIIESIIEVPLSFGLIIAYYKLFNGADVSAFDFISLGFDKFSKAWSITFNTFLKMLAPIALMIISYLVIIGGLVGTSVSVLSLRDSISSGFGFVSVVGVILIIASSIWMVTKSFYYSLAFIVAADDDTLSGKEAVEKSEELMQGNRSKLFILQLSFIGWAILAACTFGIGMLWLTPYIQFATISFFNFVAGKPVETDSLNENTEE